MPEPFTEKSIPNLEGKTVLITGANSGLGFQSAKFLANANATVILCCRDKERGEGAISKILEENPKAKVHLGLLDLSSLKSINEFCESKLPALLSTGLHVLMNNAGVMAIPQRRLTADGFEMQMGTNHLGHFALTAKVLPWLRKAGTREDPARIVNVSSIMANFGDINFEDINLEKKYSPQSAYSASKLANLLFTAEFNSRCVEAGCDNVVALSAHPGYTSTNLQYKGPEANPTLVGILNGLFSQDVKVGCLPQVRAAVDKSLAPGSYLGPNGLMALWGAPIVVSPPAKATDPERAKKLWTLSESLTKAQLSF